MRPYARLAGRCSAQAALTLLGICSGLDRILIGFCLLPSTSVNLISGGYRAGC